MADETIHSEIEELPEELVVELKKAVSFAGQTFDKLVLREPTAGQMIEWDKLDGVEADIKAVAVVSGLPEAAVKLIGSRDLRKAAKYIASFL